MRNILEALLALVILVVGGSTAVVLTGAMPDPIDARARQVVDAFGVDRLIAVGEAAPDEGDQPAPARGGFRGRGETVITAAAVRVVPFVDRIQAIGTGQATDSVTVATSVAGLVETVHFSSNEMVGAGDPLITLERKAEAIALERAKAQHAQAKAANDRYQQASQGSGTFSTAQIEEVSTALAVAEAELRQAEFEHDRRIIRAPFAGRVGLDDVAVGQHLAAGAEVVRLDDTTALEVEFLVPEAKAADARPGTPVRAMSLALPGQAFEGEIAAVDSHIDPATRTLRVRALIPNAENLLTPGMTFSITVPIEGETMPVVPALAVQWSREGAFVWRIEDGGVERVPVVIGKRDGDEVYVQAALDSDDLVAVEGAQKLNANSTVSVEDAPAAEGPATVDAPAVRVRPSAGTAQAASTVQAVQ